MRRITVKNNILALLAGEDWQDVAAGLGRYEGKATLNALFSALCHADPRRKWHAVSAFGLIVPRMAQKDVEEARVVMRRFLWNMNDESGGIGWGIPEAMAEVMAHEATLFREYVHMLMSYMREDGEERFQDGNYIELPALQRGVLWGVGRLLSLRPADMRGLDAAPRLRPYLASPDAVVRGMAAWSLGMCGHASDVEPLRRLEQDVASLCLYDNHRLLPTSVSVLAARAIARLEGNDRSPAAA